MGIGATESSTVKCAPVGAGSCHSTGADEHAVAKARKKVALRMKR
jgi:hypothetical protein